MKVAAIIQARMGSTRLPGKILKTVNGKTLLEYQIERVKRAKTIDQIIIATTIKEIEQPIVELCEKIGIDYYRGPEQDVLSRYFEAAKKFDVSAIVRLTSDCPLLDPTVVDQVVSYYLNNNLDYVSNIINRTYPRGMDTEIFSREALEKSNIEAKERPYREHVTQYIIRNPLMFKHGSISYDKNFSRYRWTVDTIEDFKLVKKIIEILYLQNPNFSLEDIINLMEQNPDWAKINAHIEQKKIGL